MLFRSGLGLHISKRIVEAHGGHIDYVSKIGKGSTFFVELQDARGPAPLAPEHVP